MSKDIERLILKFVLKEADFDELQQLELWITNPKNEQLFYEYIKTNAVINEVTNQYDTDKARDNVIRRIRQEKMSAPSRHKPWFTYAAAAVLLFVALTSMYFLRDRIFEAPVEHTAPIIVNNQIKPGTDKATLTLETGETVYLGKGTVYKTQNASSNGEEITYTHGGTSRELVHNYLTIPRGGQFTMTLSDGTRVWLNSETKLKYPKSFVPGETRQVELVYGEAYFEVSPSTEHQGTHFKVLHNEQEIDVLGTAFNIKAYTDENSVYTTLVEGKVALYTKNSSQVLLPNEQSRLDLSTNALTVSTVDVSMEISWKDGVFVFEHTPLEEIMKVLSRWYDMDVVFGDTSLQNAKFNGLINKSYGIDDILSTLKSSNSIHTYEIKNKTIVLK